MLKFESEYLRLLLITVGSILANLALCNGVFGKGRARGAFPSPHTYFLGAKIFKLVKVTPPLSYKLFLQGCEGA